jgi:ribosome maturation factor RimP
MTKSRTKTEAAAHVEQVATAVAERLGLELVEVELKGAGKAQLLRLTIDKPEGVTHEDCAAVSREVSAVLDEDDPIDGTYELEVSSPGVERKLRKWRDWQRFQGKKAKIVLREPLGELKHFDAVISRVSDDQSLITVELEGGGHATFPFEQVDRANLKFEW